MVIFSSLSVYSSKMAACRGSLEQFYSILTTIILGFQRIKIEVFHFLPCPRRFSEESEARFYGRPVRETLYGYPFAQIEPPVRCHKMFQHMCQGYPM